jgi:hypothetical protein
MVFNATFNNISVISWQSVLLLEKTTNLPQVTDKLDHIMLTYSGWLRYFSTWDSSKVEKYCNPLGAGESVSRMTETSKIFHCRKGIGMNSHTQIKSHHQCTITTAPCIKEICKSYHNIIAALHVHIPCYLFSKI